jgi:hypothetical protein
VSTSEAWTLLVQIFGYIALTLLGSSVIVAFALGLFRFFGEKWLESKFARGLEAYKHAQNKELEQLRYQVGALLDRASKLAQREFEVLPECWRLLVTAFRITEGATALFQEYPDLNKMSAPQLEEFLAKDPLENWQKDELRGETDRNKYYQKALFYRRMGECNKALVEFHRYFSTNGIFIAPEVTKPMERVSSLIRAMIVEHEINIEEDVRPRMRDARATFETEGKQLMEAIGASVQKRLWGDQFNFRDMDKRDPA